MPQVDLGGVQVPTPPSEWQDAWEDEAEAGKARVLAHPEAPLTATGFASVHGIEIENCTPGSVWIAGLRQRRGFIFFVTFPRTHTARPLISDILSGIASEAAVVETSLDERDWARNAGIPFDGTVRQKYLTAQLQARRLREWLPVGAYETLLWKVTQL